MSSFAFAHFWVWFITETYIVGGATLNEGLESLGFVDISSLSKIEVEDGGVGISFPGWVSVGDGGSGLVLIRANA
jgi:hypothetical protein